MHRSVVALATVAAVATVLAACTSAADHAEHPASPTLTPTTLPGGWQAEALPRQLRAEVLASDGSRVLVGGSAGAGEGREPRLLVRETRGWDGISLTPRTGYGEVAALVRLAVGPGGNVVALGNATGGAHLLPRWTAWSGSMDGVGERPQVFETFGGPSAGGLAGVSAAPVGAVVGSWATTSTRLSPAVWHEVGDRWVRRTDASGFASRGDVQALPASVTASGDEVVVVGTETTTDARGIRQAAIAWTTSDLTTWRRVVLGPRSGTSSGATDVACAADGCVAAGWVGDRLAAWRLEGRD
ncbi:hypothetical protein, partial [Mumia xiangluensis]